MYNIIKILRELLEQSTIEFDGNTAGFIVEDTNYYLEATLDLNELGYETDYTLAEKTSQEQYTKIELKPAHERMISNYIINEWDQLEEDETNDERPFDHAKEYGINNEIFFNYNLKQ